jgi:hypothetical protein
LKTFKSLAEILYIQLMMITAEDLINPLGKKEINIIVAQFIREKNHLLALIDLSLHKNQQIGFRAAWILENLSASYPAQFSLAVICFLDRFHLQKNLSAMRHYAKILAFLTSKNAPSELKLILKDYDTNALAEEVFAWVIDENVPVAVKSQCLNVLANLSVKHHWIKDELLATIDYLIDKESIAFFAKVKQIRKQLR